MSWGMAIQPPGMCTGGYGDSSSPCPPPGGPPPPDYYGGSVTYPPAPFPTQGPMPPGPPTPQDAYGAPPGGYPPAGDQPTTFFPTPPGGGTPAQDWAQSQQQAYPFPPVGVDYGSAAPPPAAPWGQQPATQWGQQPPPAAQWEQQPPPAAQWGQQPTQWEQQSAPAAQWGPQPAAQWEQQPAAQWGQQPAPPAQWGQQPGPPPITVGGSGGATDTYGDRGPYTRRKSLLIGISYRNSNRPLGGCINDVRNVRQFLVERFGFPTSPDYMVVLTDEGHEDHAHLPTKANIIRWMRWLVADARPGDSLFLQFSGHGGQTPDLDGDEIDGMDETILPVDYEKAGQIVDDDMHEILVKHLQPGVRMTAIFDSCHSGTALDLPYVYDNYGTIVCSPEIIANASRPTQSGYASALPSGAYPPQTHPTVKYHLRKKRKFIRLLGHMLLGISSAIMGQRGVGDDPGGTTDRGYSYEAHLSRISNADVVMFSGCSDEQTSADTSIQGVGRTGAMSYAFIATLSANPRGVTYAGLLGQMREVLRGQAFGQVPQLSSSHPMDMGQPFTL